MAWDGMKWNGTGRNGMEWDRIKRDGWDAMRWVEWINEWMNEWLYACQWYLALKKLIGDTIYTLKYILAT